jgi:uncharacterized membrane protein
MMVTCLGISYRRNPESVISISNPFWQSRVRLAKGRNMETKKRSFLKALSWRILASAITGGIVFFVTQKGAMAIGIGIIDSLIKIFVYFFHERLWMAIPYGRVKHPLQQFKVRKPLAVEHENAIRQKLDELGYLAEEQQVCK